MPQLICKTCQGRRVVRSGGRLYACPSCGGAGGVPLGQPQPEAAQVTQPGTSRAAHHLAGAVPNSVAVGRSRRPSR